MITISRTKPRIWVDGRPVSLNRSEHRLITAIGQLNHRVIPADLLMDLVFDHPVRIPQDAEILNQRVTRLRKKLGRDVVVCRRKLGYQLTEEIRFQ